MYNDNRQHLFHLYSVPRTVLNALCLLLHLLFKEPCIVPFNRWETWGTERINLPQFTQLARGRADIELKQVNYNASSLCFLHPLTSKIWVRRHGNYSVQPGRESDKRWLFSGWDYRCAACLENDTGCIVMHCWRLMHPPNQTKPWLPGALLYLSILASLFPPFPGLLHSSLLYTLLVVLTSKIIPIIWDCCWILLWQ